MASHLRILYVAMEHDYGDPARGPSYEEQNFRSALQGIGHEVIPFDFLAREAALGRERMNAELIERAAEVRPDLAFFVLFGEQITPDSVRAVARAGRCPTINWFADDHWRFEDFTRHYAPAFDWAVTTDPDSVAKYHAIGYRSVIRSQWACNRYAYGRTATGIEHQVTFVGQPYGERPAVVRDLRGAGFEVECWGNGWPAGRLSHTEMLEVFGASAINLNLSSAYRPHHTLRMRVGALLRGIRLERGARASQIKGRTFEVPGCGGFLLTDSVAHLEEYLTPGVEVAVFTGGPDLIEQVEHWLSHEEERAAVAEAGYRRVLAEHTYDHRFAEIFAAAGLG